MRPLALMFCAVALLVAPAVSSAAPSWSPTQELSRGLVRDGGESAPFASAPYAAVDATGAALVVWSVARGPGARETDVLAAAAPPGGPFGLARVVVAGAESPDLVVLPDGRALLTATPDGADRQVLLAGRVDGTFGPPQAIGEAGERVLGLFATPQGALALTGRFDDRSTVREVGGDGVVGPALDIGLGSAFQPGVLHVGGAPAGVAQGADGTLVLPVGRRVVVRRPDGRVRRVPTGLPRGVTGVEAAAVAPDGRISVVTVTDPRYGESAAYGGVAVAELRPRARRFGPLRALPVRPGRDPTTDDRPRPYAFGAVVAYDARGRRVIGWIEDSRPDAGAERETALGRAILHAGRRRWSVDPRAGSLTLTGRRDGVLALSDVGPWRSNLVAGGRPVRLAGPAGRPYAERVLVAGRARTLLAWRGVPDGGIRVATLPPR